VGVNAWAEGGGRDGERGGEERGGEGKEGTYCSCRR
jgi:hypothetical protein